jgi:hypothetical protein
MAWNGTLEGVLHVLHEEQLPVWRQQDPDRVEPKLAEAAGRRAALAAICEPAAGELPHLSALRPADGLEEECRADPAPAGAGDKRLDLAEDERPVLAGDHVDLAGPRAVVALDHLVSETLEPPDRELFATPPDLTSPVRWHGPRLGETVCPVVR